MDKFLVTCEAICFVFLNFIRRPSPIAGSDDIVVFLKDKRQFDKKTSAVTAEAYFPRKIRGKRWETSVFRCNFLKIEEIFKLGYFWTKVNPWFRKSGKNTIKAFGLISAKNILLPLELEISPSPHPRHLNIIGFFDDEAQRNLQCLDLAMQSSLTMKPTGSKF